MERRANACGRCCQDELCRLGTKVFGPVPGPCPALTALESGFGCGLIINPSHFAAPATLAYGTDAVSQAAALLCAAGAGCDAQGHDESVDETMRARVIGVTASLPEAQVQRAREIWRLSALSEQIIR